MPSKDNLYNGRKGIVFENPSYFEKTKDLRPTLYDEKVIGLGYTPMFLTHSNEALEIEKFKRSRENKIEFAYDYRNLNASYVNEKINFEDDYFQEIINPNFKKIDSPFQQTSSLKPYVPNVILENIIIDLEDEVVNLLEKEKANLETIESLKSKGFESSQNLISESKNQSENDCHVVEKECDKVEILKVIAPGMFKLSVSQSVSPMSMSKTSCESNNVENLDTFSIVKRPNNNGVIWKKKGSSNTSINTPFRKKPRDSINVRSKSNMIKSLPRTVYGVDLLTGDRSLNFYTIALNGVASNSSTCLLEKASSSQSWLWHQRLSHLNFATINNLVKNNLVQGLPKINFEKDHLCSACEQGKIHRKHHKSKTNFASNKPLYLLHMDLCGPMCVQSINGKRYVLVVVNDYSWYTWVFFLHSKDKASKVIISFIKKTRVNIQLQVQRVRMDNGTMCKNQTLAKFFDEVGITQQFSAARTPQQNGVVERRNRTLVKAARTMLTFANLPSCYLLNDYKDVGELKAKGDIGVFVGYSKESAAFRIYNKRTRKIHESVNIMKSLTTNVKTLINEEVFHEVSESFQGESSSSSLNNDVQQSSEEVILPQTNTQSISNNMIPNVDEASTSHNVFNKRLEDAYFDATTPFYDPSNVHTYYQPYLHEKK
nr:hypothetical protein [Tanacetum cinerariifolium]